MTKSTLIGALLLLGSVFAAHPAIAEPAEASHTVTAIAEVRDFSDDRGTLSSFTIEEKFENGETTVLVAPTFGERRISGARDDSLGIRGTIYQEWSPAVSTRTSLFLAQSTPVFPRVDVAQDVTFRVADRTTLTTGLRWAEYFGEQEAAFLSLGVRRYFSRGSIAYRLTGTQVDGDHFLAHLINLRVNDERGKGNTQLWLSAGDASLSQFDQRPDGQNRAFMLQRTQPLWTDVALIASAELASFESLGGDYTATTLRIGLSAIFD